MIRRLDRISLSAFAGIALAAMIPAALRADDWPQWRGPLRDGVWREKGILREFPKDGLKVAWRVPIGPGYCGPCVAAGKLYVMDRIPDPAIAAAMKNPPTQKADAKQAAKNEKAAPKPRFPNGLPGKERVLCVDTITGKTIWQHEYDCPYKINYPEGPRATPIFDSGKLYTLGAMGDLICFDSATGKVHWTRNFGLSFKTKPPVWGWSSHPLIDGKLLYCLVGGDDSAVVAFDKDTGADVWKSQTVKEVGYSPPMLYTAGGVPQLVVWMDSAVQSLDPKTGKLLWSQPHPEDGTPARPVVTIIAPTRINDLLFISEFYKGSMMLKLASDKPGSEVVWRSKGGEPMRPGDLNSIMTTPYVKDGYLYGVCGQGELRCIEAATGKKLWETLAATGGKKALFAHTFIVPNGDRCFLFNDHGEMILATLTPKGYTELGRSKLLEPTFETRGRIVVWCHPAFAEKSAFIRNDKELIRVQLADDKS